MTDSFLIYVFSTNPICKIYVCFDLQNWQDNFRIVLTCKSTKNRSPNYGLIENNSDLLVRSAFSKSSFYLHVPPRFSDLPPALRSSGFVGKNHADVGLCRRYEGGLSNFVTSETQFLHRAVRNLRYHSSEKIGNLLNIVSICAIDHISKQVCIKITVFKFSQFSSKQ